MKIMSKKFSLRHYFCPFGFITYNLLLSDLHQFLFEPRAKVSFVGIPRSQSLFSVLCMSQIKD